MRNHVIKRLKEELKRYRESLVTGKYTASQIFEEAYQIVLKQEIVAAMEQLAEGNRLTDDLWNWIDRQDAVLEYLYQLWMHCDYSFVSELMEILYSEVEHDREVHIHE